MRYLFGFLCVCALGMAPLVGCSDAQPECERAADCDDGDDCSVDVCDAANGACSNAPADDGTKCDFDGLPGQCMSGVCEVADQCPYPEGEISNEEYFQGVRCEEGLTEIFASRLLYPCSGYAFPCKDGCSIPPPCLCFNCSPCGDGRCQCELGENACNCPADCG
jgi:hypothetical protein